MVPPYRRIVTSSSSSFLSFASSESSTASSAEVAPPGKKLRLSTRRTKSITNNLSSSRKRKKSHPKSHLVEAAASPKKLKLSTSSLANQRPPLPASWLPEGWSVVWLARPSGQKYKVFKETATGKKFYSKPQVLNYLAIADSSNSNKTNLEVAAPGIKFELSTRRTNNLSSRKRKKSHPIRHLASSKPPLVELATPPKKLKLSTRGTKSVTNDNTSSTSLVANKNTTPDWLPDGWTVGVWIKATGQTYEVFKETATRKKFYSKPEVLDYLGIADSSDSNKTKVKVAPPQKKQVSTLSTTPSEIPQSLYDLIQNAATARKSLKLDSNNRSAKRKLKSLEEEIYCESVYLQCITEELPSGWTYDPETSIAAYTPKLPTPPKPQTKKTQKTKKKIKITWSSPNYHGSYQLNNNDEKEVWNNFIKDDTAEAQEQLYVPMDEYLHMVEKKDRRVVDLLGKFAVDTFNSSCKRYVNKDEDNQVSCAEFMECKFYKLTYMYIFYMTIEAIEQGIHGVYEIRVECDTEDGAKRLLLFKLTDRKPKCNRGCLKRKVEYETVQDGSSDPQDYYKLTGLVHRETEGGGFNYHNPQFTTHILVYSIRNRRHENFLPNTTRLI